MLLDSRPLATSNARGSFECIQCRGISSDRMSYCCLESQNRAHCMVKVPLLSEAVCYAAVLHVLYPAWRLQLIVCCKTTAQGLYMGVGLGLGGVVGGIIYDRFGARVVFFSAAAVIACGWLLVCVAQQLLMYRKRTASERGEGLQEPLLTA